MVYDSDPEADVVETDKDIQSLAVDAAVIDIVPVETMFAGNSS